MKAEYYVIQYSTGEYSDYRINDLFITTNELFAEKYCQKFNSIRSKWFEYFNEILNRSCDWTKEDNFWIWERAHYFTQINNCWYNKIELRN